MVRIFSNADVIALESRPYEELVPFVSPYDAIEASAKRMGSKEAICYLHSGDDGAARDSYSYDSLLCGVRQAANVFYDLGVTPGESVAFLLPSIPHAYFTLFGAETAGQACPINYLLQGDHIAELLAASHCTVLVALGPDPEIDIWSKVQVVQAMCPQLRHILTVGTSVDGYASLETLMQAQRGDSLNFDPPRRRDQVAAYFHTGGTTAAPKLAQHTQGNQVHAAWGAALMYAMDERDVIINGFPLFHVAGAFVYGLSALMSGATVLLPTQLGMRDKVLVRNYWRIVERYNVTLLAGVPTVISALLDVPVSDCNISTVRCMLTGGSPLPTELAARFEQQFKVPVRNIFGMTECAGVISIIPFDVPRSPSSCGLRLPFTQVIVVGIEHGQPQINRPCAVGETGVVLIKGPNVGPGYTDSSKNIGTFVEGGWLVSGDLGFISETGELHLNGRAKDVIIRSSHNIDPACIEEALLKHPAVQTAAAIGAPDEYAGELPVAFVTLKSGRVASEESLLRFVAPFIPERPAIPKSVTILEAMPLTPIGKIFKPELRSQAICAVIRDRIARSFSEHDKPVVRVEQNGSRFKVVFESAGSDAIAQRIQSLMTNFAIEFEVHSRATR
jgi:fatty-acyl-CoA synthase